MYVCMSHNQIIRLEDEKVNFKENLLLINKWFLKNFLKWVVFLLFFFRGGGRFFFKKRISNSISKSEFQKVNFKK